MAIKKISKLFSRTLRNQVVMWFCLGFSIATSSNDVIFRDSFESYSGLASFSLSGDRTAVKLADDLGLRWSVDLKEYDCAVIRAISPAGGVTWYLTDQGTWAETPSCLPSNIMSTSIGLPEAISGSWFMQVSFLDVAGDLLSTTALRVLATDIPIVKIRQNRHYARMGDTIRAFADVATGGAVEDVELFAILIRPDGAQVTLPGFSDKLVSAYSGPISNDRYTLLGDEFTTDGLYTLRVNLVDTNNSTIAMDESSFELCTTLTSVSGIVTDDLDMALGANSVMALVHARSFTNEQHSAQIGSDGRYALELPPGKYLVSSIVLDDSGIHSSTTGEVIEVDCTNTPIELDLVTDSNLVANAQAVSFKSEALQLAENGFEILIEKISNVQFISSAKASTPSASDGMKKPNLHIKFGNSDINANHPQWIGKRAAEIIISALRLNSDNVTITTDTDIAAMLDAEATQQLQGNDENSSLAEIAEFLGGQQYIGTIAIKYDVYMNIHFAVYPAGTKFQIGAADIEEIVINPAITSPSQLTELGMSHLIPFGEEAIVNGLTTDNETGTANLFDVIRTHQKEVRANTKQPIDPKKPQISVTPDPAMVDEDIQSDVIMEDGDGFKLPGLSVDFKVQRSLYDAESKSLVSSSNSSSSITNVQGEASANFSASDNSNRAGTGVVKASWSETGRELLAQEEYKVKKPEDTTAPSVNLDSPDMEVEPEETTTINIEVKDENGSPKTNTEVVLALAGVPGNPAANEAAGAGARLSRPTVTTDSNGQATVEFTAGTQGGAASVIGTVTEDTGGGAFSVVYDTVDYLVGGNILVQVNALPATIEAGSASVIEVQLLRTFGPVSNGAITLSLTGLGTLEETSGFTDSEGKFTTTYTAPAQGLGSATITVDLTVNATVYKGQTVVNYTTTSNVIEGNVTVTSQGQLNQLAGVTTINGLLTINGSDLTVFDLSPLSLLSSVKGLTIRSTLLYDLEGLESLLAIDGPLDISSNTILATLKGLNNLTRVNGFWALIFRNKALTTTEELESLQFVGDESTSSGILEIRGWSSETETRRIDVDLPALTRVVKGLKVGNLTKTITLPQLVRIGDLSIASANYTTLEFRPTEFILPALTQIDGQLSVYAVGCQSVDCTPIPTGIETISLPELTSVGRLLLDGGWKEIQGCSNYSCWRLKDNAGMGSLNTINLPKLNSWGTGELGIKGFYGPITINLNTINGPTGDLAIVANKDVTFNLPPGMSVGRYVQIYNNIGMGDDQFWSNWVETALTHDGTVFIGGNQ